jgi:hypothetical protein
MQEPVVHFPDSLRLRVTRGLPAAVQQAAKQRHTTPAEWARQALLRSLAAEGVQLSSEIAPTPTHPRFDPTGNLGVPKMIKSQKRD